jgi:MFS family permease
MAPAGDEGGGCDSPQHPAQHASPNVTRAYVFYMFNGCAQGLVLGPAMTAYVYFVAGNSTMDVGIVEGARGMAALLGGIPAGVVADRMSRAFVLRCAALVTLLACAGTIFAMFYRSHRVVLLGVALGLWGASGGTAYSSLEALFADSVPTGRRAKAYV